MHKLLRLSIVIYIHLYAFQKQGKAGPKCKSLLCMQSPLHLLHFSFYCFRHLFSANNAVSNNILVNIPGRHPRQLEK